MKELIISNQSNYFVWQVDLRDIKAGNFTVFSRKKKKGDDSLFIELDQIVKGNIQDVLLYVQNKGNLDLFILDLNQAESIQLWNKDGYLLNQNQLENYSKDQGGVVVYNKSYYGIQLYFQANNSYLQFYIEPNTKRSLSFNPADLGPYGLQIQNPDGNKYLKVTSPEQFLAKEIRDTNGTFFLGYNPNTGQFTNNQSRYNLTLEVQDVYYPLIGGFFTNQRQVYQGNQVFEQIDGEFVPSTSTTIISDPTTGNEYNIQKGHIDSFYYTLIKGTDNINFYVENQNGASYYDVALNTGTGKLGSLLPTENLQFKNGDWNNWYYKTYYIYDTRTRQRRAFDLTEYQPNWTNEYPNQSLYIASDNMFRYHGALLYPNQPLRSQTSRTTYNKVTGKYVRFTPYQYLNKFNTEQELIAALNQAYSTNNFSSFENLSFPEMQLYYSADNFNYPSDLPGGLIANKVNNYLMVIDLQEFDERWLNYELDNQWLLIENSTGLNKTGTETYIRVNQQNSTNIAEVKTYTYNP